MGILRGAFKAMGYLIITFAAIGIFISRYKWREWLLMGILIIYINLVYSLIFSWARYAVPLLPFYLIFASVGIFEIKHGKIIKRRRINYELE